MNVAFLLNHYDIHQVPHIVPYAFELTRRHPALNATILAATEEELSFAREIGEGYPGHRTKLERLQVPGIISAIDTLLSKVVFVRKALALASNREQLRHYTALVSPELTCIALRTKPGFETVKMIFTGHGSGDNRLGGSFNARIGKFDLALLPGRKYAELLNEDGHLPKNRYAITGYPKFEAVDHIGVTRRAFFHNDRPTIVYNPHHNASLSSWPKLGCDVLDFFYESKDYNLIFAPHILLFKRPWSRGTGLPKKYRDTENVRIDLSSRYSSDMTYLRSADIYLGDVSSQVYEFVEQPRPCVFLNGHGFDPADPSYRHWSFGPVINDVALLADALTQARNNQASYSLPQRERFDYTFETGGTAASIRGADVIADFLTSGRIDPKWQ
jgi:hypothetical protein